jgi:hypothetical protein
VQKIKRWKSMSKRPIGRPKTRWKDDDLEAVRSMDVRNWKQHRIETAGGRWLSEPEPYIGCSALEEEEILILVYINKPTRLSQCLRKLESKDIKYFKDASP